MGNLLRKAIHAVSEGLRGFPYWSGTYPYHYTSSHARNVCYSAQQEQQAGDTSGGRGQLRESPVRCTATQLHLGGRQANNIRDMEEAISGVRSDRIYRGVNRDRERGDRPVILPIDAKERKAIPIYSGVVLYFPKTLVALARVSKMGNDQHNPGKPLQWDRSKSGDELDALMRHILDGEWEKVAWRAMANCEKEIENGYTPE